MNLFPPFSEQSKAELAQLASVQNRLVNVQASQSNITIVQDCLLGNYMMTRTDDPIPKDDFFQILHSIQDIPLDDIFQKIDDVKLVYKKFKKDIPLYSGKTLFSLLLPRDFMYNLGDVKIYMGILYEGSIKKANLGSKHQSIIRILTKEYSNDTTLTFINNVQFLAVSFLMYHGFSVGISDCLTTQKDEIRTVIARSMLEAENVGSDTLDENIKEVRVTMALGRARDIGMRLAKNAVTDDNRFLHTINAGSKGDFFNFAQIGGLLGQQNVKGQRIQPAMSKKTRTLPHYTFNPTPQEEYESKGFIRNSFIHGLNPQEFWAHASTGREGVLDTALKTANSGYIQRKMVKIMEDMQVKYDNTVRNSVGSIIQFAYGGDGLDGTSTVIKQGSYTPHVCDIERLADRLNLCHEMKIEMKH